ncbi:hypothetical protein IM40_00405 [Candidatus Paracaedimonas acanthamoebae]|nr:hypothetical protein IM40_00405 [Candidatus Paracaedimonas acanthamoebae]
MSKKQEQRKTRIKKYFLEICTLRTKFLFLSIPSPCMEKHNFFMLKSFGVIPLSARNFISHIIILFLTTISSSP